MQTAFSVDVSFVYIAVIVAGVSYVLVSAIRSLALRFQVLDVPNERSSHAVPTPRGAGLAILVLVLFGSILDRRSTPQAGLFVGYWIGVALVGVISAADDLWRLSTGARLLFHLLAAVILVAITGLIGAIAVPGAGALAWRAAAGALTCVWLVGLTNAYNFMDGIDGIAAGQAIVAGTMWYAAGLYLGLDEIATISILLVGASAGFLFHNWPPARIFMGDVGSATLGFTFAALPVLAFVSTGNPQVLVFGVLVVAPFVFDTALTWCRRAINRERVLEAHRSHLYQRLIKSGYSHGAVSAAYSALALLTGGLGLAYLCADAPASAVPVWTSVLILVSWALIVTRIERTAAQP